MTDHAFTLYRLAVALLMPAGEDRNIRVAACTWRLWELGVK